MADYPRVEALKTRAEEKARGARPYAVLINPRQVIGWQSSHSEGQCQLTELRIKEQIVVETAPYGNPEKPIMNAIF